MKAKVTYYMKVFICSPDKGSIHNLNPNFAYFQSLAWNFSTCECQLLRPVGFFAKHDGKTDW